MYMKKNKYNIQVFNRYINRKQYTNSINHHGEFLKSKIRFINFKTYGIYLTEYKNYIIHDETK